MNAKHIMDRLIGIEEAAQILGLRNKRVGQLLRAGVLRGKIVGNSWVLYAPDVRRLALQRRGPRRPASKQ